MNKKVTSIVCYLTIFGWLIAFAAGDRQGAKRHLSQSLVLTLITLVFGRLLMGGGPLGWVCGVVYGFCLAMTFMGIVYAATDSDRRLPLIGLLADYLEQYF